MKKHTGLLKGKSGMTYVEMLVALFVLALIVVTFTPMLLVAYDNTYKAGSITQGTYESRVVLEESLAVRYNDQPHGLQVFFSDATSSLTVRLRRVFTYINDNIDRKKYSSLETLYGTAKPSVSIISGDTVYDDSSTQTIKLQFVNFDMDTDGDGTVEAGEFSFQKTQPGVDKKNAAGIVITAPLKDDESDPLRFNADSQVTLGAFDSESGVLEVSIKDIDVTYSPLKITIGFYKDIDDTKLSFLTEYLTIKPASIMIVGKSVNATTNYYTTAGLVDDEVKLEARSMTGGGVTEATFNAVRWVGPGTDQNFSSGYYAMCGNNGIIRRLWSVTEDEAAINPDVFGMYEDEQITSNKKAYKYVWAGDYTEIYTYGDYSSNIKGNNSSTGDRHFAFGTKANTFTKYTGFKNGKSGEDACQQISYNIANGSQLTGYLKSGEYFTTVSGGMTSAAGGGMKKGWSVNWEDYDGYSFEKGNNEGGLKGIYSGDIWANYVVSTYASSENAFLQPAVFFASTGGAQNSASGGQATISATNQIDRVYLMTDNFGGRTARYDEWDWGADWHWWVDYTRGPSPVQQNIVRYKKKNKENYYNYDVAATFTEIPAQYKYSNTKTTAQNQQTVLDFIYDYLLRESNVVNGNAGTFTGVAGTSSDEQIGYLRLKAYTNANDSALSILRYDGTSDADKDAQDIETTAAAAENAIMSSVKINLTDLYYIPSAANYNTDTHSGNSMVYTGFTPASAIVYATVPGDITQTSHGTMTSGIYRVFEIIGTANGGTVFSDGYEKGYTINQFADYNDHHNSSKPASFANVTSHATNSTTAFTLGYSSNHLLTLGAPSAIIKKMASTVNTYLDFPNEFTNYVNFSGDDGIVVQAGYRVSGYATNDAIIVQNCKCSTGTGAHGFGSNPATLGSDFFYNPNIFKVTNEDLHTLDNNGNMTYKKGYYMEGINAENSKQYSGIVLGFPTCATAFTGLKVINNSNVDANILNSGVLSVIFDGMTTANGIYEEKPTGTTSLRFTSSAVYMSGTSAGESAYTIIFGGTDGKLRVINKYFRSLGAVTMGGADTSAKYVVYDRNKTTDNVFTDVKDIDCKGECVVAVGAGKQGQGVSALVYDITDDDAEWEVVKISNKANVILYDVECVNGVYYAVGTIGTRGVLFYTDDPLDDNWECIEKDINDSNLQPLYSLASSIG